MGSLDPLPPGLPGASAARSGERDRPASGPSGAGTARDRVTLSAAGRLLAGGAAEEAREEDPLERVDALREAVQSRTLRVRLLASGPPGQEERLRAADLARDGVEAEGRAGELLAEQLRSERARALARYREVGRTDPRNLGM